MTPLQTLNDPTHRQLATKMSDIARHFYGFKWLLGTSGSLSCRVGTQPLQTIITVSGNHKGELSADDFLLVSDDGRIFDTLGDPQASSESLFKGIPKPSGETLVHRALYDAYPEAGAVFHVHSVAGTLCSQLGENGGLKQAPLEMHKGLGRWSGEPVTIPIVENALEIPRLAHLVANASRPGVPGVLVEGHGIYVWGEDIARCRRHVEIFEFLFEYEIQRRRL